MKFGPDLYGGVGGLWRVVEPNGRPCICWLPGLELADPEGALDRGGFELRNDAQGYALGVNWERAFFGLLDGVTTEDIDQERAELDRYCRSLPEPWLDDDVDAHFGAATSVPHFEVRDGARRW